MHRPAVHAMATPNPTPTDWRALLAGIARRRSGAIGLVLVGLHLILAVAGGGLTPYDPLTQDSASVLQAPSAAQRFKTTLKHSLKSAGASLSRPTRWAPSTPRLTP